MIEGKKILFIINKFAGGGFTVADEQLVKEKSSAAKIPFEIEYTKGPGHATTLAKAAASENFFKVVAVGGDGTLNEVAQGLINSPVGLGIIPRGSGNGLARHLSIPLSIKGALDVVLTGIATGIDTFTLNNRLSLNVSGIGFDGRIANLFGGKTKRGLTGYAKLTVQEFFQYREFDAQINIDGNAITRKAFIIAIANSSQYGNNACIVPSASVSDGILHLNVLRKVAPYRVDFVYAFFSKKIDQTSVAEIIPAKKIQIRTPSPVAYHVDGEPCGEHDLFEIEIHPLSLQVVLAAHQNI